MAAGQKKNIFFHADFNLENVIRLTKRLRQRTCTCDDSQIPRAGALNWAIFLEFDDGVEWVFRAPWSASGITQKTTGRLLASEVATLKYIRQHTSVPVPEVYDHSPTYENDIGIPYILMSKATGRSLAEYEWQPCANHGLNHSAKSGRYMTDRERHKIMYQLGCYARQLFSLRLPAIGSLFEGDDGYHVGACLSPGHVLHDRETIADIQRGPFHNETDYYSSLANALHLHAEQLPMGHHILCAPVPIQQEYSTFAKYYAATDRWNDFAALAGLVESSSNRLQYCIASRLIEDCIIPSLVSRDETTRIGYPLFHHDISLQNLFVDDELNITCVIDWAFSSTVPPAQLLAPPGLPHPRDLTVDPSLIDAFRSGFETEKENERHSISSDAWKVGQMVSRFMRVVNMDALQDYNHLKDLYVLASSHVVDEDDEDTNGLSAKLAALATTADMLALARELAADDEPESQVHRHEQEYFGAVGLTRLTAARKVALAAKMNPGFVADGRLWRGIDAAMEDYDKNNESASIAV